MVGADRSCCLQKLARRTDVDVARLVEGEVLTREGTVLALRLVDHQDVRSDFQPEAQGGARASGRLADSIRRTDPYQYLGGAEGDMARHRFVKAQVREIETERMARLRAAPACRRARACQGRALRVAAEERPALTHPARDGLSIRGRGEGKPAALSNKGNADK